MIYFFKNKYLCIFLLIIQHVLRAKSSLLGFFIHKKKQEEQNTWKCYYFNDIIDVWVCLSASLSLVTLNQNLHKMMGVNPALDLQAPTLFQQTKKKKKMALKYKLSHSQRLRNACGLKDIDTQALFINWWFGLHIITSPCVGQRDLL